MLTKIKAISLGFEDSSGCGQMLFLEFYFGMCYKFYMLAVGRP